MKDQYDEWAGQVVEQMTLPADTDISTIRAIVAAALRGVVIESLEYTESVVAAAANNEKSIMRREGIIGARMVIRALSMAIKNPLKGDVKPVERAQ